VEAIGAAVVAVLLFWRALNSGAFARVEPEGGESAHHGGEVDEFERLDEEGICAEIVGLVDVVHVFGGSKDDNAHGGKGFVGPDFLEDFETVEFGHFEIEQEEVWKGEFVAIGVFTEAVKVSEAFLAIADDVDWIVDTSLIEGTTDEEDIVFEILGQEDDRMFRQYHGSGSDPRSNSERWRLREI